MPDTNDPPHPVALSIIVCTYNRSHLLAGCIESVGGQLAEASAELVVVNDGSQDATESVLSSTSVPFVRGGWSINHGLNAARNDGIRLSAAPILLFFDDDQLPPPGFLKTIVDTLSRHPELDGIGGPLRDYGGSLRTCDECSLGDSSLGDDRREVDRLIGGNMAIRASAFDRVGPFDDRLSGRGDETEWFGRAQDLTFVYDPELWVWHRRDSFGFSELLRYAFRQGRSAPVLEEIDGTPDKSSLWRVFRFLGHAATRRCSHGLELAARELGGLWERLARKLSVLSLRWKRS